jgi:ketosteroid isomerase-like protein
LVEIAERGRGRGSGAPVERAVGVIYTVIGGRIVRITVFPSAEAAREAIDGSG